MEINNLLSEYVEKYMIGAASAEAVEYSVLKPVPFVRKSSGSGDPKKLLPNAKSVIVVCIPYQMNMYLPPESGRNQNKETGIFGRIADGLCGNDYHITVKEICLEIAEKLRGHVEGNYRIQVDNGCLNERYYAVMAGLGFIGRNNMFITERFGSYVNIGLIITDVPFDINKQIMQNRCGGCRDCIIACPGGALGKNDFCQCVSYYNQKKGELSREQEKSMGAYLYGCDICQRVCPLNHVVETVCDKNGFLELNMLLKMSKMDFDAYQDKAFYWRGIDVLKRNAGIIAKQL